MSTSLWDLWQLPDGAPGLELREHSQRVKLAQRLAEAVAAVHATGGVIGHLDDQSVQVAPDGSVTFSIADGTSPAYAAPELQSSFAAVTPRTVEHDLFALAVLLFQVLMDGHHPYVGTWRGGGNLPDIPQAIQLGLYAYGASSAATPPSDAPSAETLGPGLAKLFAQSFSPTSAVFRNRPQAAQWVTALNDAQGPHVPAAPPSGGHTPPPLQPRPELPSARVPGPVPVAPPPAVPQAGPLLPPERVPPVPPAVTMLSPVQRSPIPAVADSLEIGKEPRPVSEGMRSSPPPAPRPSATMGRRIVLAAIAGMAWLLWRAVYRPGEMANHPRSVQTTTPSRAQPAAGGENEGLLLPEFRNDKVDFRGSDFAAQVDDGVLQMQVLGPEGYGYINFDHPPMRGKLRYQVEPRTDGESGDLLVTLTDADTRTIWIYAFNLEKATWRLYEDERNVQGLVTVIHPRGYRYLIGDDDLHTITITRISESLSLRINDVFMLGASGRPLPRITGPLIVGIGAYIPLGRVPADTEPFEVLITRATLDDTFSE